MKDQTSNLRCKGLICVALGVITLAVFAPSFTHDFVAYDDQVYVTENPHVLNGLSWTSAFGTFVSASRTSSPRKVRRAGPIRRSTR